MNLFWEWGEATGPESGKKYVELNCKEWDKNK